MKLREAEGANYFGATDKELGREHIRQTMLSSFLNCKRKYEFTWVKNLEPTSRRAPLEMGGAFQLSIAACDPEVGVNALREGRVVSNQAEEDQLQIDEVTIRSASRLYLNRWKNEASNLREYPFRVRIRNPNTGGYSQTFDLQGTADGLADQQSHWKLIENKFVGSITPLVVKRLPLDRQLAIYTYGLWRATGKKVREVSYRHTRKPTIRVRQNEKLTDFLDRLSNDYEERPDFYTHEENLFRSDEDLLRIEAELWVWTQELLLARKMKVYPRNSSMCHEYGGCPFIPICTGDPDAMSLYRERNEDG